MCDVTFRKVYWGVGPLALALCIVLASFASAARSLLLHSFRIVSFFPARSCCAVTIALEQSVRKKTFWFSGCGCFDLSVVCSMPLCIGMSSVP